MQQLMEQKARPERDLTPAPHWVHRGMKGITEKMMMMQQP